MTIQEFNEKKDEFLIYIDIEKNLSENTQRAYKADLEQLFDFWQSINKRESIILPFGQVIKRFLVMLYHKKINKSSIARKLSCIQSFQKFLLTQGIKLSLQLTRPRIDKKLPIYLTIDEIFHLLDTVKDHELPTKKPYRDKAIFELLYATGIRCAELVNIKLCDINMENRTIIIFGKGRRERIVLFGKKAAEKLISYLSNERPKPYSNQEHLFLNYRNSHLTTRSIQRIIQMFRKFLKIERNITPHKIRHSFATHLLNKGADLRIVQELLGHKTLSSTEKYTHVSPSQLMQLCNTIHPIHKIKPED